MKEYYFNVFFIKKYLWKTFYIILLNTSLIKENLEVQISNDNLRKYSSKKN